MISPLRPSSTGLPQIKAVNHFTTVRNGPNDLLLIPVSFSVLQDLFSFPPTFYLPKVQNSLSTTNGVFFLFPLNTILFVTLAVHGPQKKKNMLSKFGILWKKKKKK